MTTAVVLFSRLPQTEAKIKILSPKEKVNELIWRKLYFKTQATVKSSNLTVLNFTEKEQTGKSFAEKITNTAKEVFTLGFDNIIFVGSDSPGLKRKHLIDTENYLQAGANLVAGKNKRGGIYLLGINKNSFDPASFFNFKWQTSSLFSDIKFFATTLDLKILTPVLDDINLQSDAVNYVNQFYSNAGWKNVFLESLHTFSLYINKVFTALQTLPLKSIFGLRAPPAFLLQ